MNTSERRGTGSRGIISISSNTKISIFDEDKETRKKREH